MLTPALIGLVCAATGVLSSARPDAHPFLADLPWDAYQDPHERFTQFVQDNHPDLAKRALPYPVYPWITQNDTTWATLAQAGVSRMQDWYTDSSPTYTGTSWWQQPVILASLMDLDVATGNGANENLIQSIFSNNERGVNYIIDAYVDDQAWWGWVTAKAYQIYGTSAYLSASKAIQSSDVQYWTSDCGGGLLWLTYKPDYGKNTVTNSKSRYEFADVLHFAMDVKLYQITGQASYLSDALRTLNWWLGWAYDSATGKVYDTLTAYDCTPMYLDAYTYNSGIPIGGLVDLYTATKNETYLAIAKNIAYAAMRDFSTSSGIMQESCEHYGAPQASSVSAANGGPKNDLPAGCQSDTIMFKAILAQNLGYYYKVSGDVTVYNYLSYNFLFNAAFNVDDTMLFSEWWGGPYNATLANQLTQGNALGLLSAGVSVQAIQRSAASAAAAPSATAAKKAKRSFLRW